MTKHLYKFYWDCGRMGWLDGLFIADEVEVAAAIGKYVNFHEALGKHSEVVGRLEEADLSIISDDQELLFILENTFGKKTLCGRNPVAYIQEREKDEEI
jgi:hypothetical protein